MFINQKQTIRHMLLLMALVLLMGLGAFPATAEEDTTEERAEVEESTETIEENILPELSYKIFLGNNSGDQTTIVSQEFQSGQSLPAEDLVSFFLLSDEETYGFVLPGSWDLSDLRIYLSGVDRIQIGDREYRNGDRISLVPDESVVIEPEGQDAIEVTVCQTGGLPVLYIETESGSSNAIHADKTYKEPGSLLMTDADGNTIWQGGISAVRTRGNATFHYNKKPYQIKLEERVALTGDRKGKTWILLANALDRSLIRNTLAFALARYSGAFAYTPCSQPVDLYVNHDYKGTYLLVEKVEIGNNRLPIVNLEKETENLNPELDLGTLTPKGEQEYIAGARKYYDIPEEPEDLTGGYLVQMNVPLRYPTEASGFITRRGIVFTSQEPKYVSEAQMQYISGVFQQIEDALFNEDGIDPASGKHYTELLDLTTFVNMYLMAEVLDNFDGQYCYYYKDSDTVDPKVYAGPVWDQDNILGVWLLQNDPTEIHLTHEHWQILDGFWFTRASRHEEFMENLRIAYRRVYRPAIRILLGHEKDPSGILKSIEEYAEEVSTSAQMDFFRWEDPMGVNKERYNKRIGNTFDKQVQFLKEYLTTRKEALDDYFCHHSDREETGAYLY